MGELDPNLAVGIFHGKIGGLVLVRRPDGTVFVRHAPVRTAEFTPGELVGQSRLAAANRYVHAVKQQPALYAAYKAAAKLVGKRGCDLAKADFAHPPEIHEVELCNFMGRIGDAIRVRVVDDFGVIWVAFTLSQLDGTLLEHGQAVLEERSSNWLYLTQVAVPVGQTITVHVTASDRPENTVTKTVHHPLLVVAPAS